jgi:hypothetical protein
LNDRKLPGAAPAARTRTLVAALAILAWTSNGRGQAPPDPAASPAAPAPPVPAYEVPPELHPAAILPDLLAAGTDYHVVDPVQSDGLMNHYVLESKFGRFEAYGKFALAVRVNEVRALTELDSTSRVEVVGDAVVGSVKAQVNTATGVVTHPVKTVTGIPHGIQNLLRGYRDTARETVATVGAVTSNIGGATGGGDHGVTDKGVAAATDYARHYAGLSDAERLWYEKLRVDPYSDNATLRKAISDVAKLHAAANFGTRYIGLAIPGIGTVTQVTDAIYHESPSTIRARTRARLQEHGLTPAEIEQWEKSTVLNPTQQVLLLAADDALAGVAGRGLLFRHALGLSSKLETSVYLQSVRLLVTAHRKKPLVAILPAPWLPAGARADGQVVVCAAFDSVYWTEQVAKGEPELRAALPTTAVTRHELWLTGAASDRARSELAARGWDLRESEMIAEAPPARR